MRMIYDLILRLAQYLLPLPARFNPKVKALYRGHKYLFIKIECELKNDDSPKAWFHSASLGEFEQGRPIIEAFREANPDVKIVLTFFSPSGYEVQKNCKCADYVFYLPFDTLKNAAKFVEFVNPVFAVFIKYEFWANYIHCLKQRNIPTYSVSSIFRHKQTFFQFYGLFFRRMLQCFTHFFVQDEKSKKLLNSINIHCVTVTGDTRFDRVVQIAEKSKKIETAERFVQNRQCIVAGSTWMPDEEILFDCLLKNPDLKMIIAPHEIKPENIARIKRFYPEKSAVFSEVTENTNLEECKILIIDNMGMLSSLYRYGQIAYIGGGFGIGIHNTPEAAVYGIPVIFGPNYKKFAEAIDLIEQGAAFTINSATDFYKIVSLLLSDSKLIESAGKAAKRYVIEKTGATNAVLQIINR